MNAASPAMSGTRRAANSNFNILKWVLIAFGLMVGILLASLLLLLFGIKNGAVGLLIGVVCATLPVPIYMALLLWIDRFEPEPPWLLALTFGWGAVIATFVAAIFNDLFGMASLKVTNDPAMAQGMTLSVSAPMIEESMKASILFIVFFWRKHDFDGVVDGIVYAGMVALGFAMMENVSYYGNRQFNLTATLILRGMFSPFAHPLFTSMTGIGLGISRESKNRFVKVLAPFVGLSFAMLLHSIWNTSTYVGTQETKGIWFIVVYIVFMVPMFFGVLGIVIYALIREGRMVRRNLDKELSAGVLSAAEVRILGSVTGRFGASTSALFRNGLGGWVARRRFHEAASQLAFHRNRISAGTLDFDKESIQREQDLLFGLKERKSKL